MAKRKSKKLTIEELSKEMINEDISVGVTPVEEIPISDMDPEITGVEFEEPPVKTKSNKGQFVKKSVYDAAKIKTAKEAKDIKVSEPKPDRPDGMITLQEIGDRMRVIRAKKRSSDPKIQAEGTKELKDLNDELHAQVGKMKAFFGR